MENEILSSTYNRNEDLNENNLRPSTLSDFQGQDSIKENLKIYIEAAKLRGDQLDHIFIAGPPGLGKTTLANIIANEMNTQFKVTSAPALEKPKDLAGILTSLEPNSIFFIDEIHRLRPVLEEMLYIAMEDFQIDWLIGQGASARSIRLPVSPFTLVGATTKSGSVSSPLYSRFGIDISIPLYSEKEIEKVLKRSAEILKINIEEKALKKIAICSRGTPRIANRLLKRIRDFAQVKGTGNIDIAIVDFALKKLDIDVQGLGRQDKVILKTIIENYSGGPVGGETLAISIGEAIETLEDFFEPFLIRKGFLQRTPRGRVVTKKGYLHLGINFDKLSNDEESQLLF